MSDIWTVVSAIFTALGVVVGAGLVAYQLRLQRRWHIQHSTLEMATRFVEGDMFKHWVKIRHVMAKETRREAIALTGEDKEALLAILSYFETIGVMDAHGICDMEIVKTTFSSAIVELHEYAQEFIKQYRISRQSRFTYCEVEALAKKLAPLVQAEREETARQLKAA